MDRYWNDRVAFVVGAVVVVPLGFLTRLYSGPGHTWIASSAGGVFYILFWVFVVLAIAPRLSPGRVSIAVLVVTSGLEFLQLWHPVFLTQIRSTLVGQTLLGSTFAWVDFPPYLVGSGVAFGLARYLRGRGSTRHASPGHGSPP